MCGVTRPLCCGPFLAMSIHSSPNLTSISPSLGSISPAINFDNVVFPAPLNPTILAISPSLIVNVTPSTDFTTPRVTEK